MKKRIAFVAILVFLVAWGAARIFGKRGADPGKMLEYSDLSNTSVSYSWTEGFMLYNCEVHAIFSGDGQASLQIGENKPIRKNISQERYRQLLSCMAENGLSQIKVKRRWGQHLCDIGRYELSLKDSDKTTVVYVDSKHYVDKPELLDPIFEMIYTFENEFSEPLDYGPLATACIHDEREIMTIVTTSLALFLCIAVSGLIWLRNRNKKKSESMATQAALDQSANH